MGNLGLLMKEVYLFDGVGPVAEELEVYEENIRRMHHHPLSSHEVWILESSCMWLRTRIDLTV